jgi:beta-1,2-mannobiose phosphorylase / 1,2-beta-oligomannan phosphorylase
MVVPKKKIVKKVAKKKKLLKPAKKAVKKKVRPLALKRSRKNPIMGPIEGSYWESEAVFNPGAVLSGGRVHLFYRALGADGVSRIGYVSSRDGTNFDNRCRHPVFMPEIIASTASRHPYTSPARLEYNRTAYASGGGWGGSEDPRVVKIDGRIYMTFNFFNGWYALSVGLTSISEADLENCRWNWRPFIHLSAPDGRNKNWVLFPEKIGGKFALLHNLHDDDPNRVMVEFVDDIEEPLPPFESPDPHHVPDRIIGWHNRMRSVGPPPVKTKHGWLVFYHAMDKDDPGRYKLGAMLLDLNDPRKIVCRSKYPVLEPDEWYENDWKPGIIYASGAIIRGETLFVYYGGGDKYVGVASTNAQEFVEKLLKSERVKLSVTKTQIE